MIGIIECEYYGRAIGDRLLMSEDKQPVDGTMGVHVKLPKSIFR